ALQGLRRGLYGGVRSQRLESAGSDRSRRAQLPCPARRAEIRRQFLVEHDLFGKPASTFPDHAHFAVRPATARPHQKSSVGSSLCSWECRSDASRPTCRTIGESPSLCRSARISPTNSEWSPQSCRAVTLAAMVACA